MAAKQEFEPHEIPKIEPTRHTWYSPGAGSQLKDFALMDDATTYLLDDSSMSLDGFDLKKMFQDYDPQQLIQVISRHGVMLLGDMEIEEWLVKREFEGRTTLTIGKDAMHLTDWKQMWWKHLTTAGDKKFELHTETQSVKVEAFVVTIRNAAGIRQNGLLYPLIKRWEANACPIEVWGLATVRALVSYKWNHWARKYVAVQFFLYVCWVLAFIVLALNFKENDLENNAIDVWEQGERGNLNIILVVLAQLLMFPFTYLCISRIRSSAWQWFNLWNMIDMVTQCMQVVCTVVYLCGAHPRGFDIMLGTQVVLLIAKIQFYARAFVAVDSSMLDTLKAVVGSIRWYLLLLILTVYSFACALFILFRKRLSECEDFANLIHSIMSMFSLMLGELEVANYYSEPFSFNESKYNETYWETKGTHSVEDEVYNADRDKALKDCESSDAEYCERNMCYWQDPCKLKDETCQGWNIVETKGEFFSILFFLCIYMVTMSILLYHLLIAMVIDSHSRVIVCTECLFGSLCVHMQQMEVKKLWVHLSRAEIINIMETALPRKLTQKYAYAYIHVLRVIPMRSANLDKIWHQAHTTENSATKASEDFELLLSQIQADILSRIEVHLTLLVKNHSFDFEGQGISERIRMTVGIPEEEYRDLVFRKMGIAQVLTMSRRRSFRMSSSSRQSLLSQTGSK